MVGGGGGNVIFLITRGCNIYYEVHAADYAAIANSYMEEVS